MDITWSAGVIGTLAFIVSLITEVTKDTALLKKIPTDLQVLVLAQLASQGALLIHITRQGLALAWYMPVLAIPAGFMVAFIARYGWSAFGELKSRFLAEAPAKPGGQ